MLNLSILVKVAVGLKVAFSVRPVHSIAGVWMVSFENSTWEFMADDDGVSVRAYKTLNTIRPNAEFMLPESETLLAEYMKAVILNEEKICPNSNSHSKPLPS